MNQKSQIRSVKAQSTLVRPQYSPGLLLSDDDLTQAVDYTRNLSRMLFKSLLGCGVVCGLVVKKPELACGKLEIKVAPGVALDCHGDPVYVQDPVTVSIDPSCGVDVPPRLWVLLRRADKHCAPRSALCSQDDDDAGSVCTRIRDGIEVSVVSEAPKCACGCAEPANSEVDPMPGEGDNVTKPGATNPNGANATSTASTPLDAESSAEEACYADHYKGVCTMCCAGDCESDWIMLARLDRGTDGVWGANHSVRRFIRPVLMTDPQVAAEKAAKA